jgi:PAS domain S-box-containing protein
MKGADLAWWDWNIQSGSLVCDKFFSEMLGYSADEILPRKSSWEQLVHPDDASRFAESLKAHFENTAPYLEIEHRVHSKSGDWKWVSTRGRVVERDQAGRPLRVSGTNLDITQAKEAQERIDALTQAMIQAQERERERVSLDLHDQVAQSLAAVRLSLQTIFDDVRSANPELSERIAQVSAAIREIARDVRDLSYELRPPGLDQLGLTSAVRQYCREFSTRHGLSVDFFSEGIEDLPLDFDTEINIFRVIQEGLNNVAKHAGARRVVIRLTVSESKIDLSIKDDGRGFDVKRESADAIEDKRMGLWCMAQRIGLLRGQMDVVSGAPEGTEIVVEIPCGGDEPCGKKKGS